VSADCQNKFTQWDTDQAISLAGMDRRTPGRQIAAACVAQNYKSGSKDLLFTA